MHLRLVKSGYAGSIAEAREMDARTVIQALNYDTFCSDYEWTFLEINKGGG